MIALLAAVPLETELLRRGLAPCEVRRSHGYDLLCGTLGGRSVCLLHGGIGKANAAAAVSALCAGERPEALLLFGCCGAYPGSGLAVGDLVLATEECYGDEGVLAPQGFLDMAALGFSLAERNGVRYFDRFPVDGNLLAQARPLAAEVAVAAGRQLAEGVFVTVSTCSGTARAGEELVRRTGGLCENMEGAAAAQICARHAVPFLELRGISNLVEDRDLARWDLRAAAEIAQRAILSVLAGERTGASSA
jgi:futalosine hydrolase